MAQIRETFLFQPTSVSSCVMWFDAAESSTVIRTGTNVTQWNDKTGNGNTATAGTATYPVYNVNTLNGFPTISLNAGNDYFLVNNNLTTTTYPSLCYFIVIRPAASQPSTSYAGILSTDSAGQYGRTLGFGAGNWQEEYYSNFTNITLYTPNVWTVVSLQFFSTVSATLAVNGTTYAGTASGTGNNTTGFKIGSYNDTGGYATFNANFDVAEIMVYGTNVSTAQRQQLEGYLAWKWGLQGSLPVTHPFKNYRPLAVQPIPPQVPNMPTRTQNTAVFTPLQASGCRLWIDASDPTAYRLSGSSITQVIDKSPTPTLFSNATGFSLSNTFNGTYPSFFNASLLTNATLGVNASYSISQPFTVFFVAQRTAALNGTAGFLIDNVSGSGNRVYIWDPAASAFYVTTPAATNAPSYVASVNSTEISSSYYFFQNGSQATVTSNNPPVGQSGLTLGNAWSLNTSWAGHICEMIFYSGSVSISQRQQVEGYLAWKWGLTGSLPASHPYKKPLAPFPSRPVAFNGSLGIWQPTRISGCQLWLDAADRSSFTLSGLTLTSWRDKSGTSKTITINSAPTYSLTGFNTSYPAFSFTTSNLLTTSLSSPIGTGDCMLVAVMKNAGTAAQNDVLSVGQPAGTTEMAMGWNQGEGLYKFYQYANGESKNSSAGNNANIILIGARLSSTMFCFLNGNAPSLTGTNGVNNANTTIYIDGGGTSFTYFGEVCEIILYVGTTTTFQRQQVEGYLAWKWGLVGNLPTSHPYKLFPPSP